MASKKGGGSDAEVQTEVTEYTDCSAPVGVAGKKKNTNQIGKQKKPADERRRFRKTTKTITKKLVCGSKSVEREVSTECIDVETSTKTAKGQNEKCKGPMTEKDKQIFRSECLQRHNELRKKHQVCDELKINERLQAAAQTWAEELVKIRRLKGSSNHHYGENLAYECSSEGNCTGAEICDKWYGEVKNYNFCKPGYSPTTGHFTQLVWAGTKEIGIGVADDGKGGVFAVANYQPPGNDVDSYEANVKKGN